MKKMKRDKGGFFTGVILALLLIVVCKGVYTYYLYTALALSPIVVYVLMKYMIATINQGKQHDSSYDGL